MDCFFSDFFFGNVISTYDYHMFSCEILESTTILKVSWWFVIVIQSNCLLSSIVVILICNRFDYFWWFFTVTCNCQSFRDRFKNLRWLWTCNCNCYVIRTSKVKITSVFIDLCCYCSWLWFTDCDHPKTVEDFFRQRTPNSAKVLILRSCLISVSFYS